jgi:hypothetical protein
VGHGFATDRRGEHEAHAVSHRVDRVAARGRREGYDVQPLSLSLTLIPLFFPHLTCLPLAAKVLTCAAFKRWLLRALALNRSAPDAAGKRPSGQRRHPDRGGVGSLAALPPPRELAGEAESEAKSEEEGSDERLSALLQKLFGAVEAGDMTGSQNPPLPEDARAKIHPRASRGLLSRAGGSNMSKQLLPLAPRALLAHANALARRESGAALNQPSGAGYATASIALGGGNGNISQVHRFREALAETETVGEANLFACISQAEPRRYVLPKWLCLGLALAGVRAVTTGWVTECLIQQRRVSLDFPEFDC